MIYSHQCFHAPPLQGVQGGKFPPGFWAAENSPLSLQRGPRYEGKKHPFCRQNLGEIPPLAQTPNENTALNFAFLFISLPQTSPVPIANSRFHVYITLPDDCLVTQPCDPAQIDSCAMITQSQIVS